MDLIVEKEDVWIASLEDKPGALAGKLIALADAGADLDFVIARRSPERPGMGVMFVTPLRGDAELKAASEIGFSAINRLHSVRVEGENQAGIAGEITDKLSGRGINLRGKVKKITTRAIIVIKNMECQIIADFLSSSHRGGSGLSPSLHPSRPMLPARTARTPRPQQNLHRAPRH